jgi:hypothetical protein
MLKRTQLPTAVPTTCQPSCPDPLKRQIAIIRDAELAAQSHSAGEDMSDHLKYFTEHLPATFVLTELPEAFSQFR